VVAKDMLKIGQQPRCMPGRAGTSSSSVKQHHINPIRRGQMIGIELTTGRRHSTCFELDFQILCSPQKRFSGHLAGPCWQNAEPATKSKKDQR